METKTQHANGRFGVKQLSEDDRPREKLSQKGRQFLSNAELLAILLGNGTHEHSALDLGRRILKMANNSLDELARMNVKDLVKVRGIGPVKALSIVAALELGRRKREETAVRNPVMGCSTDAYIQFEHLLEDLPYEEFWILLLSRNNSIIGKQRISTGGISATTVDPKVIFKYALEAMASGIVLCHNHPSGSTEPSNHDIMLTRQLADAGRLLDILISDHLIIGHKKYFSFADAGLIKRL